MTKSSLGIYDERMNLIEKMDKDREYSPSPEELETAYGYLDYCFVCGERIRFFDSYEHSFVGNSHRFGCAGFMRILGACYKFFMIGLKSLILSGIFIGLGFGLFKLWDLFF
jgi:hypothetical protein